MSVHEEASPRAPRHIARRVFVAAFLSAVMVWPIAHYSLVRTWGLDQWKFGGWAMYTTMNPQPVLELTRADGSRLPPHHQTVYNRVLFEGLQQMIHLGSLVDVATPTARLLETYPPGAVREARLEFRQLWLDPRSGMLVERPTAAWEFRLDEAGRVVWRGRVE